MSTAKDWVFVADRRSVASVPMPGVDFPQSYADLLAWFRSDEDALDYLEWLRWGECGFVCPACGADCGWRLRPGLWSCQLCSRRVSVTAGTIFDRTRTPLTVVHGSVDDDRLETGGVGG